MSKYITYWYGGLDRTYLLDFFRSVRFENESKLRLDTGEISPDILLLDPCKLNISWSHGIEILIKPLLLYEAETFLEICHMNSFELLDKLFSYRERERIMSFKEFLESSSLFLLNLILEKKKLPVISLIEADSFTESAGIKYKYIDVALVEAGLRLRRIKRLRTIHYALCELRKRLRGYISCTRTQFEDIFTILSKKPNRAVAKMLITLSNSMDICLQNKPINAVLSIGDIFQDIIESNDLSAKLISEHGNIKYITGPDMIEVCFKAASSYGRTLVLQKFIRDGGYEKYQAMMSKYPGVSTDKSAVDIWNTDIFPEYDTNIFKGAKYLKNVDVPN
jgi:hypothetical protein